MEVLGFVVIRAAMLIKRLEKENKKSTHRFTWFDSVSTYPLDEFFFFFKKINLLIQVSNTIDKNTELKMLKTLKNDTVSKLIEKMIC